MSNHNFDIRRAIPAEFANGGYGNFETAQSLSNTQGIDPNLLQHENPARCSENDLAPRLPLEQYRLNIDQNPCVIRRKPQEKVQYLQEIAVRYLKPPPPPRAGDIVIKELPAKQVAPAPPLIVRQQGPKAPTPPPVCIRECPPHAPQPLPGKTITVPGKTIPPPARKVIVERLPPVPPKPQQVFVERWLPYGEQRQRVVYEPAKPICQIPDPRNVVIQWDAPDVEVRREVKNLGVHQADPQEYVRRHGNQLLRADALPEVAVKYAQQQGVQLAAGSQASSNVVLEGDVQALSLIDLEANGLGYLRGRLGSQSASNFSAGHQHQHQHQHQHHHHQQSAAFEQQYDSGLSQSFGNLEAAGSQSFGQGHGSHSFSGAHAHSSSAIGQQQYSSSHHNMGAASFSAEQLNFGSAAAASGGDFGCDEPHAAAPQQSNDFPC